MTSVENVPNLFCPESDLESDSVYISLEGPAVAGAAHRTPAAHVDARSRCAMFSDRDPAVVVRVSDALTTRLALRCSTTGTLLGDAIIDVRALAARGTACRLRVPMQMTGVARRYGHHHGHASYRSTVTCLALAVRGRSPEDETSWDARPHKVSNKNGADRRMMDRREPSHLAMHHAYGSTENPSATVVDVRRRLRSALVVDRCEMQEEGEDKTSVFTDGDDVDVYEMDDIDDEDTLRQLTANTEQDKWSDVDAVTDIDEVSLAGLSSVFQTVDTARPVAHDHMLESAGLQWYKGPRSSRSFSGVDESVVTKGPIEYL